MKNNSQNRIKRTEDRGRSMKRWMLCAALAVIHCSLFISEAQAQTLTGRAVPSQVAVGQQFRLQYTVNTQDAEGFRAGTIPDAFEVLMGPSTSTQSSFQMVNGHTSSTSSITYTYVLMANKKGTFNIPPAHVLVNNKAVQSNQVRITVGDAQQGAQGQQQQNGQATVQDAGAAITGSDLFIKVTASKKRVREQEPILLSYKVYTRVGLAQMFGNMPDLKSFYTRKIPTTEEKQLHLETLNGKTYQAATWEQYVMYPQVAGKLEVPSITFEGIVIQKNTSVDPFERFFNGGSGYIEVKKKIQAPGVTIEVEPLPERPANFSGGVGRFKVEAQLEKTTVKANDPVRLKVTVSGSGNMKLLKEPVVNFPRDFDHYDAKVTDKTKLTTGGLEGQIVYDFLVVPRHQGDFEIPPIEYVYFDLQSNAYKTVKTAAQKLHVEKGSGSASAAYTGQEDVKQLNKDIRHIKTGTTRQHAVGEFFFGSAEYWVVMAVLMLAFVSLFIIFRQRAIDNADVVGQRAGRANKVATKRLKKAAKLMAAGRQGEFYDEVLRALWGYVGDKLSMPVEQLSRENISQQLTARQVSEATIQQFIGALDECEYARYAPGDAKGNMNKVYDAAMTAITQIATTMKKKKGERTAQTRMLLMTVVTLSALLSPSASHAVTKAEADSAYVQEHYQKAAQCYEQLLEKGVSPELYYNLGNCYYRMDDMTKAVLNYERARLLSPGDDDIRFNLQMARSKTIDRLTPESEMFFVTWYRSLVSMQSVDAWARTALVALALAVALALLYLFAGRIFLRKVGFFGGIVMLLLFVGSNLFAWQQKRELSHRTGAIIVTSAVSVKSTPSKNGTDLFVLHEGTRVDITDDSMQEWREVKVADGRKGWIETKQLEII